MPLVISATGMFIDYGLVIVVIGPLKEGCVNSIAPDRIEAFKGSERAHTVQLHRCFGDAQVREITQFYLQSLIASRLRPDPSKIKMTPTNTTTS
jgi:hypothetical protein